VGETGAAGELGFDINDRFVTEDCRLFVRAWARWRGGKLVPSRHDIDLGDIASILSQVGIIEVRSKTEAYIRLVGTSAQELTGSELTGQNWINIAPPEQRAQRGDRLWQLVTNPCASWAIAAGVMQSGFSISTEFAAFPVAPDDSSSMPQIMGCFRPVSSDELRRNVDDPLETVRSEQYVFLDIGAGIPENAAELI
jgi:hypothetical protein